VKLRKTADIREGGYECVIPTHEYIIRKINEDASEDDYFTCGPCLSVIEYLNAEGGIASGCFGDMKTFCKNGKLEKVAAVIKSCTSNTLSELTVTLKDLSGGLCHTWDLQGYILPRFITFLENVIVAGADNRPSMLDKTNYSSWASRMLLYINGKPNRKLLVDSVLNGPFQYRTIVEPGTETTPIIVRARTYTDLTDEENICKSVDITATNIVLQGLS
nr:hypothetical protein [Tanacetum cinerariifolium]